MVIRLGRQVFTTGIVSSEAAARLFDAIASFVERAQSEHVTAYRAVGTSALREAKNGAEIAADFNAGLASL